jgi:hypothetical protein
MTNPTNSLFIDTLQVDLSFTLGATDFVYDGTDIVCAVPVDFTNTVTIGKNLIGATTTVPLLDLIAHSTTVPLFLSTADVANALVFENVDNTAVTNSYLDSTGRFFSRRISADAFAITTQEQTVGAVTLAFTGASMFACDATGGTITYTLPTLDTNSPSGYQFTFKKTDVSVHPVFVSTSGGQSIDGATSVTVASQWGVLRLVSVVSGGSGYWLSV